MPHTIAPKRDIVTTRSSVLFHSYKTLVRFRHYSNSLSFHSVKRPSLSQSRLNALHSRRSHYTNPDPHSVIFHCVICFLRSNLLRGVLPSQPTFHTVQAAFAFTFLIVFNFPFYFRDQIKHFFLIEFILFLKLNQIYLLYIIIYIYSSCLRHFDAFPRSKLSSVTSSRPGHLNR